ncbi:flagellar filament capping protein FliD [Motilimonas sp. 1_MG-2023]|uniref:flagellar filament capping protein FliD n=1 Tax=Motilimonas TaxID=1914248 RepID=UPI0026E18C67|nr:flagellar filament capping protein FliD [Motilimonas sp. 1_MG-2023]MDO6524955.1 flagellar filament capping protein FliD [Motilimonas sp. 1_MG-2023]
MATLTGIGSGLDLESIISTFVKAEQSTRVASINERELDATEELSGVGTLKSSLSQFQDVLKKLSDPDTFFQNKSSYSYLGSTDSSSNIIKATTDGVVTGGTFEVEVLKLAQGSRLDSTPGAFSAATDTVGSGVLTFGAGSNTFDISVDATDTLEDIQKKINDSSDNFGVKANIINSDAGPVLTYTSEVTGLANQLSVTNNNASLAAISTGMVSAKNATDAEIKIDGQTVTSSTNTFSNAISGIALEVSNLTQAGEKLTLDIGVDTDGVEALINDFVDGYNALQKTLNALSDPTNGPLAFDSSIRSYESQLRSIVGSPVTGTSGALSMLYDAGITMNADGELEVSSIMKNGQQSGRQRLDSAISNNLADLGALFAGDDGVAKQLSTFTASYLENGGVVQEREAALKDSLTRVADDREKLGRYMESYEATLRQKYTALDVTIAQYNATSSYIESVLKPIEKK